MIYELCEPVALPAQKIARGQNAWF